MKKRLFAVVLAMVMMMTVFTAVCVTAHAEGEIDEPDNGLVEVTVPDDNEIAEVGDLPTEEVEGTTNVDPTEEVVETEPETIVEETEAVTEAVTEAATTVATADETKPAPTDPAKKPANSPKTGDSNWLLWVGIGVCAVAVIAIIATVIVKKKKAE